MQKKMEEKLTEGQKQLQELEEKEKTIKAEGEDAATDAADAKPSAK
jgi:hypothetical protein